MSDLSTQLNQILANPEMMEQIRGLSGLLSQSAPELPAVPPPPKQQPTLDIPNEGIQMAMKLAPLLSSIKQEDDTTRLLRAVKPFLSPQRGERLEEAVKIIQILKVLPLVKGSGLFGLL
ncbi:MAG: hypothetical protein K2M82_06325 [Lachnospiraceae bacterium]|nr:hypothetical protein [Lachnospiraceae bacterium]